MNNLNEVRSGIANYQPRHRQDYIEDAHSHQHIRSNISQYERKSKLSRQHVSDGLTRFIHALSWGCGKAVFLAIVTPPNWVSRALGHTHFTHLFLWLEWQYQHNVHDLTKTRHDLGLCSTPSRSCKTSEGSEHGGRDVVEVLIQMHIFGSLVLTNLGTWRRSVTQGDGRQKSWWGTSAKIGFIQETKETYLKWGSGQQKLNLSSETEHGLWPHVLSMS